MKISVRDYAEWLKEGKTKRRVVYVVVGIGPADSYIFIVALINRLLDWH